MKHCLAFTGAIALATCFALPESAAEAADQVDEVIVTGTRAAGVRTVDSATPVQILGAATLSRVGQPGLIQAIAQNVPSFNAQAFGNDTANLTLSARLRGLSPNHTLVLIDGKRRHGTANLAVLGGPFQGGATADLNFVPQGAVERIEVLQDGAAAQYGSDAIAGVINIILKKGGDGVAIVASGGKYFDGGGLTGNLSLNLGVTPVENSYVNLTYETRWHGHSQRGDIDPRAVDTPFNAAGGGLSAYPGLTADPDYPYVNRIQGDAEYRLNVASYNAGYRLGAVELYSFGSYGRKFAAAYENWRAPTRVVSATGVRPRPLGFKPKEVLLEDDYAATLGLKGQAGEGWTWELATTYGKDQVDIEVRNSLNAALYADTGFSPTDFFAGAFIATQWTTQLDVARELEVGMAAPITLAFGGEYRRETYGIVAGDPASRYKEGSQSYPGFLPSDAGKHSRRNVGLYADAALQPVAGFRLDIAGRYEHFSDFGDTGLGKVTARYDVSPTLAIRAAASTGFRAPTLAEEHYSATNVSPTTAFVQLPPNSAAAGLLGVDGLKAEKSRNFSAGLVAQPGGGVSATLDVYQIDIDDRIVGSGALYGRGGSPAIAAVTQAILANGNVLDPTVVFTGVNIFVNGLDTRTRGAELAVTAARAHAGLGTVQWSLIGSYNKSRVTRIASPPRQLGGAALFDVTALDNLATASPRYRVIASALWTLGPVSVTLRETLYGPSSLRQTYDGTIYYRTKIKAALLTDFEASYDLRRGVRLTLGANNLFNRYPDQQNPLLRNQLLANNDNSYVQLYPAFSPFGINGGYYYAKVGLTF